MNLQPIDSTGGNPLRKGFVNPDVYAEAKRVCLEFARENPSLPRADLLIALIALSIEAGANTMKSIIGAVRSTKRFNTSQIAVVVNQESGADPERCRWHAGADGFYSLHEGALG